MKRGRKKGAKLITEEFFNNLKELVSSGLSISDSLYKLGELHTRRFYNEATKSQIEEIRYLKSINKNKNQTLFWD